MALLVETPVKRIPYRWPNPSQFAGYSSGFLNAVFQPALKGPATSKLWIPPVESANHFRRSLGVIGTYFACTWVGMIGAGSTPLVTVCAASLAPKINTTDKTRIALVRAWICSGWNL